MPVGSTAMKHHFSVGSLGALAVRADGGGYGPVMPDPLPDPERENKDLRSALFAVVHGKLTLDEKVEIARKMLDRYERPIVDAEWDDPLPPLAAFDRE